MATKIWAEDADKTDEEHNRWVRHTRLDVWLSKAKHLAILMREGVDMPTHPDHHTTYVPMRRWITSRRSAAAGPLMDESSE